jgi:hypothetical protein
MEPDKEGNTHYSIRKEHISFVVTGPDHFHWIGYAFANTSASDLVLEDTEEYDGGDEEGAEPEIDYLACDGQGEVHFVDHPVFDPRLYWLQIVRLRLCIVRREWDYLIHKVENSIRDWVSVPQNVGTID